MKKIILLVLLIPFILSANTLLTTQIVPLQHQLPENIVSPLKALYEKELKITHFNNQIILHGNKTWVGQAKETLLQLDKPLAMLTIQVRFDLDNDHLHLHHYPTKHWPKRVYHTDTNEANLQTLKVMSGHSAFISTGKSVPFVERLATYPDNVDAVTSLQFKNVEQGFYIKPFLKDKMVTLHISPFFDRIAHTGGGQIKTFSARTLVDVPLNEWTLIGETGNKIYTDQELNFARYYHTTQKNKKAIWVKITQ